MIGRWGVVGVLCALAGTAAAQLSLTSAQGYAGVKAFEYDAGYTNIVQLADKEYAQPLTGDGDFYLTGGGVGNSWAAGGNVDVDPFFQQNSPWFSVVTTAHASQGYQRRRHLVEQSIYGGVSALFAAGAGNYTLGIGSFYSQSGPNGTLGVSPFTSSITVLKLYGGQFTEIKRLTSSSVGQQSNRTTIDLSAGTYKVIFDTTMNRGWNNPQTVGSKASYSGTAQSNIFFGATPDAVPEPASIAALSLGGLAFLRRRRK